MNLNPCLMVKKTALVALACFVFLAAGAQTIYIDTVSYEGSLELKGKVFRYKRVKSVAGTLTNDFKVADPELNNPEDETLMIFDKSNRCVLTFTLNEIMADHNNATIMNTDCRVTDSSLRLTRFSFWWASYPVDFPVGVEFFEYSIDPSGALYLKDSSAVFSDNPKQKLKISKQDNARFRQVIRKALSQEADRVKMYQFLE